MQYTALITGASSGLGAETARYFINRNCTVYGTSRKRKNGEVADGIIWIKLDLEDPDCIAEAVQYIKKEIEAADVIIHNAGIGSLGSALDFAWQDYEKLFKTNFFGLTHFNHLLRDYIIKNKTRLVFVSSLAGEFGLNYRAAYVATKHALEGYAKSLRMELKPLAIPVSVVAPGDIHTEISASRWTKEPKANSPLKLPYHRAVKKIDSEVDAGLDPKQVAKQIFKVATQQNPKHKYIVAKPLQQLSNFLYHTVPYRWFENLIINHYNQ